VQKVWLVHDAHELEHLEQMDPLRYHPHLQLRHMAVLVMSHRAQLELLLQATHVCMKLVALLLLLR